MGHNRSGSSSLVDQSKQRRPSRAKPRLPLLQKLSFSVGHFLNDAVVGAWISYLLIFETKVLGMSNRTVGFLWITSSCLDAVLCLVVGYICDNYKFPFLAKYYGKRKSFHLLGTVLVAGLFPFLMMPCFVCGEDSSEWTLGIYYGSIMIVHNIGWALSQVTHLALIPEIAKRPSEMVELHALRSGFTFLSGIFMYAITWIVLRTDGGDDNISPSQWKDFMEMSVIVVGTGCFFSLIFHLGTKEPPAVVENNKGTSGAFVGLERQRSRSAKLPLPDKAVGVFCLYDERDLDVTPAENPAQTEAGPMEIIQEEQADKELGVVKDNGVCSHERKDVESRAVDLAKGECCNEFSFSNPAFRTDEKLDFDSEKTVSDFNENSGVQSQEEKEKEKTRENEFSFSNPAFLKEDKLIDEGAVSQERDRTVRDSQNEEMMEERQSNRSDSSDFSEGYASSPENDLANSFECPHTTTNLETEKPEDIKQENNPMESSSAIISPMSLSFFGSREGSFSKGTDTSCSGVSVIIEVVTDHEAKSSKTRKTWSDWFKTPMFYKISFAYMCARLVQVLNSSYVPLYLTETLGFEKESIAYFPLVILVSGVFSSLGAKKLDKMLGEKWTYSLTACLVIGSSAWFYLQGESGRNAAYCAAILVGCGSSIMYVTSLSLAGKLVGDNKESGAFVFASMCILSKVACGASILVIQELFPSSGATGEYVRYVFSVGPGAVSLLGFLAVIAFLPATVKCKKVVHTADCSVQTEEFTKILYAYDNRAAIMVMDDVSGGCKAKEFVTAT